MLLLNMRPVQRAPTQAIHTSLAVTSESSSRDCVAWESRVACYITCAMNYQKTAALGSTGLAAPTVPPKSLMQKRQAGFASALKQKHPMRYQTHALRLTAHHEKLL